MHPTLLLALSRRLRVRAMVPMLACAAMVLGAGPASADTIGSGPVLLQGYSHDQDGVGKARNIGLTSLGWRWTWDGADCIDDFLAKGHIDFAWAVEPLIGGVYGEAEAFEASVVPYVRLSPLGWDGVVPWFEGGIGVAYTTLHNYGLGSAVEFSDDAGIGISFDGGGWRWSVGYRFRHLSHLGLFDDKNDGLNAHFLTLTVQ